MIAVCANIRHALSGAIAELEQEAENYRDGDDYQPRGKTLHRLAKKASEALAKALASNAVEIGKSLAERILNALEAEFAYDLAHGFERSAGNIRTLADELRAALGKAGAL